MSLMMYVGPIPWFALALVVIGHASSVVRGQNGSGAEVSQDAAKVRPASGEVNIDFSRIYVHAKKKGFGHEHAVVGVLKSGSLHLDTDSPGKLVFDLTSFRADGDDARKFVGLEGTTDEDTQKQVNDNLLGKDVLNVKKYPTAEFEIKSVRFSEGSNTDERQVVLEGEFSLHGETKPISVTAVVSNVKGWNHIRGSFKILQTDYGIKPFTKAFGAVGVADELTIWGDLYVAP